VKTPEIEERKETVSAGEVRLWAWNVNGVRATLNSGMMDRFIDDASPAVLCLNETKIDEAALQKEGIPRAFEAYGFPSDMQFWNCCKIKKGYSGTAILISKSLQS